MSKHFLQNKQPSKSFFWTEIKQKFAHKKI